MSSSLIVVESPNKIKSIQSYVGNNFIVLATGGHIRELKKYGGYNPTTYDLQWTIIDNAKNNKKEVISKILKEASKADEILLATDPDREGEAISWHVYDLLPEDLKDRVKRITFNEITKKAIDRAINEKHEIDQNLVGAQFTRRVFDRAIGFKLSTIVQRNLKGLSAGRVQSVALLFIVLRELERRSFVKVEWYEIYGTLKTQIPIYLQGLPNNNIELLNEKLESDQSIKIKNKADAEKILKELSDNFIVENVDGVKLTRGDTVAQLTTDRLLQQASNYFGWSANKTTLLAQTMFEGLQIDEQHRALISYPRTDSERLSEDFLNEAYTYIEKYYGKDQIVPFTEKKQKKSSKPDVAIQDAHEAIRPVDVSLEPSMLSGKVSNDIIKLYTLIWTKTVASLMKVPTFNKHTVRFDNKGYKFISGYKTINELGYWRLPFYQKQKEAFLKDNNVFEAKVGDVFTKESLKIINKETLPPPYYTEASLIAALKQNGVGRPSTYASMATIGTKRGYVTKEEGKLIPTDLGINIILQLQKAFPGVISIEFTKDMETNLDKVASGLINWKEPLREFLPQFDEDVKNAYQIIEKVKDEETDRLCPNCGSTLVIKMSRWRKKFIACPQYPKCVYAEPLDKPDILDEQCPMCQGQLIRRKNKKNQFFIGCNNFPQCNYIRNEETKKNKK